MNLISKLLNAAEVPIPPAGYGATYIDILDGLPKVKLSDGTIVELRGLKGDKGETGDKGDTGLQGLKGEKGDTGLKGEKGDTGVSANMKSVAISFSNKSPIQTVSVTDSAISIARPPTGFTTLSSDPTWDLAYRATLASVSNGSFVVNVQALDVDGDSLDGLPLPDATIYYLT